MLNPQLVSALSSSQSATGMMHLDDIAELQKALQAGYGTDVASLTDGGALRIQSLDKTLMATIQENKHFRLFNKLMKSNATATVDEWTEQSAIGGFLGGSTNTELGTIAAAQGSYNRRTGLVKYLMTRREVSFVTTLQNASASAEAVEQQAGAKQLLTDAEYLAFEGDSAVVATEFDGIYAQLQAGITGGQIDNTHILDAGAAALSSINLINTASANIAGFGNFGTPTDLFVSQLVQGDFDSGLDPAFRVNLDNNPESMRLGAPVRGIRTSWGDIALQPDVFIRDDMQLQPFEVLYAATATANAAIKPQTVTADASVTDASSTFTTARAGNYYWAVAGITAAGQSAVTLTSQTNVAAGKKVTLTITASAGGTETGYVIYRSRLNGSNSVAGSVAGQGSDFRYVGRVAKAGGTTTFVDNNALIPGTSKAYMLNMSPGDQAITWRQLLPMLKFPLYPTVSATIPWAQLLFGYLRISKRRHHVAIKNILPNGAVWRPFN